MPDSTDKVRSKLASGQAVMGGPTSLPTSAPRSRRKQKPRQQSDQEKLLDYQLRGQHSLLKFLRELRATFVQEGRPDAVADTDAEIEREQQNLKDLEAKIASVKDFNDKQHANQGPPQLPESLAESLGSVPPAAGDASDVPLATFAPPQLAESTAADVPQLPDRAAPDPSTTAPPQLPESAPVHGGGSRAPNVVSGGASPSAVIGERGRGTPPQLPDRSSPGGSPAHFSGGGGNADWVNPAIGLLEDITNRHEHKRTPQLPERWVGGEGIGGGAGGSGGQDENGVFQALLAEIKELNVNIKKLNETMDRQARQGGAGKDPGMMKLNAGNPKATFDLLKTAVADSGNSFMARQSGSPVARPGPAIPGGAAQGSGITPGSASPSATGAAGVGQRANSGN